MAKPDGDRPLSEGAEDIDDCGRDLVSDLTEFDVRSEKQKHSSNLSKRLQIAALALIALFVLFFLAGMSFSYFGIGDPPVDAGTGPDGVPTDTEDSGSSAANPDASGPTSGTWDLYVTNSEGNESLAFTVRFMDDEYGTVEFPYDDRAYDGAWDINGDQISFGFARDFDGSGWGVTEWSSFEGTLVNADLIIGNWFRDDWSCTPDDGCSTKPVPASFDARLVLNP